MWIIYARFHFTTTTLREYDMPGYDVVNYMPSKEVNGDSFNWQAFFDNDANNAIQIAGHVYQFEGQGPRLSPLLQIEPPNDVLEVHWLYWNFSSSNETEY